MSDEHDKWHRAVCNELEGRVKNRAFLVWVNVEPGQTDQGPSTTPEDVDTTAWVALAESAEGWLEGLDQNAVDDEHPAHHDVRVADLSIELTASPKKTKRQGTGSLVGNPYPGIASFTESHATGPAAPFDDGS